MQGEKMYETLPAENFLGLPPEASDEASSQVIVLPLPYEGTVSYGGGTREGPQAIIQASRQVELYDREFGRELALEYGVHTLPYLAPDHASPEATVDRITAAVAELARPGRLLVGLGGEHTVSVGVARGLAQVYGTPLVTVQWDAHSDLRESYEGSPYSHACVARHFLEIGPVFQAGIRAISLEEVDFIAENPHRLQVHFAEDIHGGAGYLEQLADFIAGKRVFLTIDLDGFDPAYIAATGTPEPNGMTWQQGLALVRTVVRHAAEIVGFDIVELAPIPGQHASDFFAARFTYKVMNLIVESRNLKPG